MMVRKYILLIFVSLFFISCVSAELYYSVSVEYNNGELLVGSVDVVYSRFEKSNFYSGLNGSLNYKVSLIDSLGDEVYVESISVPNELIVDYGDDDGNIVDSEKIVLENVSFDLFFPYSEDVNLIVVELVSGEVVERVDVRTYSKVKGEFEDEVDGEIVDVGETSSVVAEGGVNWLFWILLVVLIALVILLVVIFLKRK